MATPPRRKRYQHLKKNATASMRGRWAHYSSTIAPTVQLPQPPQRWKLRPVDSSTTGNDDSIRNSADPVVDLWLWNNQPPIGHERAIRKGIDGGYRLFEPFEVPETPLMASQRTLAASSGQELHFVGGEDHRKLSDPYELMFNEAELEFMNSIVDYLYK